MLVQAALLQLTSGVWCYLSSLTISFLLFSVQNFTQNIIGVYYCRLPIISGISNSFKRFNNLVTLNPNPQSQRAKAFLILLACYTNPFIVLTPASLPSQIYFIHVIYPDLKGCVCYVFASLFLGLNDNTCQIQKNIFYFTSKPPFVLEKIKS